METHEPAAAAAPPSAGAAAPTAVDFDSLISGDVIFFPVRHHSPACAWHLGELIRERRPRSVLIEGPAGFTPLIPFLLDPATRAPVAVYTNYVDTTERVVTQAGRDGGRGPARFAAYYPFCEYSPEWVALRAGAEVGARLRFIDLDYPDQVVAERAMLQDQAAPRVDSLLAERHLKRSAYLTALAKRTGCRDQDDLWDHMFESRFREIGTPQFIREVAAYCYFSRADSPDEILEADGTLARECAMATAVVADLATGEGPVLVVTGGFHTVVLPDLVRRGSSPRKMPKADGESLAPVLVRYSFEQLDSLNGYAAGMPSPFYYDRFWGLSRAGGTEPYEETAAKILVEIGRLTRDKQLPNALSTADEIAALEHSRRLARLRGHKGPTREDLLDGVRSCFVKGSMDAEGAVLMGIARHVLSGTSIGDVPPGAGVPPLVEDFRATARSLRLNIDDSVRRKLSLDLYRSVAHRRVSRFLHCLDFLKAPFAVCVGGPDFVRGRNIERLQEHWDYAWSPRTEASLVEASVYGSTVEDAAANRLRQAVVELEHEGRGRSATEAVGMLVRACRMGLHRHASEMAGMLRSNIGEDPSFTSLAEAMNQLLLLWHSREPLEAHGLTEIPPLLTAAHQRACYLVRGLANCPDEEVLHVLAAMCTVREVLVAAGPELLDADLFFGEMAALLRVPQASPAVVGGAAGVLRSEDRLAETALANLIRGQLGAATSDPRTKVAFVTGLLRTCREAAWQQRFVLESLNELLAAWEDDEFVRLLPDLRIAFSDMTPRETDKVAGAVAALHGRGTLGQLVHRTITEAELAMNLEITRLVRESLKRDGLEGW